MINRNTQAAVTPVSEVKWVCTEKYDIGKTSVRLEVGKEFTGRFGLASLNAIAQGKNPNIKLTYVVSKGRSLTVHLVNSAGAFVYFGRMSDVDFGYKANGSKDTSVGGLDKNDYANIKKGIAQGLNPSMTTDDWVAMGTMPTVQ